MAKGRLNFEMKLTKLGIGTVVSLNGTANQNSSALAHMMVDDGVVVVATDVVKVNIDAIRCNATYRLAKVFFLVVDHVIESEFISTPLLLLFRADYADNNTALFELTGSTNLK